MTRLLTEGRLAQHPFVRGATDSFLNHLEEFSSDGVFEAGAVILKQGEYADRFYLIRSGQVAVETGETGASGKPNVLIQILGPGDPLGWSWLFPPFKWHFTARALEPVEVIVLNGASLLIRAEADQEFGYQLMRRISERLITRLQATRKLILE